MVEHLRSFSYENYRFRFNGKENDNEVEGNGNWQNYGMRCYDPRLGRFASVDPLIIKFPWYSPYQFAGNKPIVAVDLDGLEEWLVVNITNSDGTVKTQITHYTDMQDNSVNVHATIHSQPVKDKPIMVLNYDANGKLTTTYQDAFTPLQQNIINTGTSRTVIVQQNSTMQRNPYRAVAPTDLKVTVFELNPPLPPAPPIPPQIVIQGIGAAPPNQPLNFNINARFTGGQWVITNLANLRAQLAPVVNFLNANANSRLFVTGNVAGNPRTQTWNSPSITPNINFRQLATNRAQSVVNLVRNMGLINAAQAINAGTGFIRGGFTANGTVQMVQPQQE